jgi:hypothetical protein
VPGSSGSLKFGHMDNFSGVSSLMNAYFSSNLPRDRVHCKVTYGEEKAINGVHYAGARDVMTSLKANDLVAVIDVTGSFARQLNADTVRQAPHLRGHVIVEKVGHNPITRAILDRLSGQCIAHDGHPVESTFLHLQQQAIRTRLLPSATTPKHSKTRQMHISKYLA